MNVAIRTVSNAINYLAPVESIDCAVREVRECIEYYEIPSSGWIGGQVYDENNNHIGNISYNGRYFPKAVTLASVLPNNCFII